MADKIPEYEGATIINIRRGDPAKGRGNVIYARLVAKDGTLLINATLAYITEAMTERLPDFKPTEPVKV